jgi:glycosyltransferase involved in cell wall biosynthesis
MVGLLLTKNEEAIVGEVLSKNEKYFDAIYALDGSTDNTPNILKKISKIKKIIFEKDLNVSTIRDGIRQVVIDEIKRQEPINNTWVTLLHGDEIFYHNPRKVAEDADCLGYDKVEWYAMQYFLHSSDKDKWNELASMSIEERVTWYATNEVPWVEFRQFKLFENTHIDINTHSYLEPANLTKLYHKKPIYKHYKAYDPYISLDSKYRWGTQGSSIFVDVYRDNIGNFRQAHKFEGNFGKWEEGLEHLK